MEITKSTLEIGLEKPVKVLHVTDTHVALTDERDDERCRKTIARCQVSNNDPEGAVKIQHLRDAVAYANAHCDILIHTGDFLCNVAIRSIEACREALEQSKNSLICSGNHEYTRYGFDSWEDFGNRMNIYPTIRGNFRRDVLFSAKVVGGVNFICVDDSDNQFDEMQLIRLKNEVKKGLPIVLCMHVPLYEPSLYEACKIVWPNVAGVVGLSEELLAELPEFRAVQHRPAKPTLQFIEYVNATPLIKALLTGHLHFDFDSRLPGGAIQYVTHKNFDDRARELTIV